MLKRFKPLALMLGLALMAGPAFAKAPINDKLPVPDGKAADMSKKVKVVILMGQSNMLEYGRVKGDKPGTLQHAVTKQGLYPFAYNDGKFTTRMDVRSVAVMESRGKMKERYSRWLTTDTGKIGVEVGVGHHLGNHFDAPVMVLKSAIGNRSLGWDLLPPGSERYEFEDPKSGKTYVYPGYKDEVRHSRWEKGNVPDPPKHGWYAGKQYDDDVKNAKKVLANLEKYYPGATGYEVVGFIWFQGCKDKGNPGHYNRYEKNLATLIKALRKDFNAPDAKFAAASLGETKKGATDGGGKILEAIMNIANPKKHPEFKGDVAGVYSYPLNTGKGSSCGHYGGNAETYMNIGLGLGEAMVELLKNDK